MSIELNIDPEWNIIKRIKESIDKDEEVALYGKDFIEATKITAIELVENAFKYSDADPKGNQPILFSVKKIENKFVINVSNYCVSKESKSIIKKTIDSISNGDPFALYVERLQKITNSPDGYSRLGFYRISYEAGYRLEYKMTENSISVIASRTMEF